MSRELIAFVAIATQAAYVAELRRQQADRGLTMRILDMVRVNAAEYVRHKVRGTPTLMLLENGVEVERIQGVHTGASIRSYLTKWGM